MIHPSLRLPEAELAGFCRRHKVRCASLFGSATRSDFNADSDVDILLEFDAGASGSLLELVDMQDELAQLFGRKVDIATSAILKNPYRRREILRDLERIHGS